MENTKIRLSKATPHSNKATTFGFKVDEVEFENLHRLTSYYSYSAGEYDKGHRKISNLTGVNPIIMFDVDNGMSLEEAQRLVKDLGYKALIVTTSSHQKEKVKADGTVEAPKDKFRVIFEGCHLDIQDIINENKQKSNRVYKIALRKIADTLGLLGVIDANTLDISRQFHPNIKGQLHFYFEGISFDWTEVINEAIAEVEHQDEVANANKIGGIEFSDSEVVEDIIVALPNGAEVYVSEHAKEMTIGTTTPCFCPNPEHIDSNPSAFIFNNEDSVGVHCSGCGHHQNVIFKQEEEAEVEESFRTFDNKGFVYNNLQPLNVAMDFRDNVWLARNYGVYPEKFLDAHTLIASAFNKIIKNNTEDLEPEIIRIPSPTGSGKSEMLIYYTSALAQKLKEDDLGVLIVTKFKSECDRIASGINELVGKEVAFAYHGDSEVHKNDLRYLPIVVTTHAAFEIRSKGQYRTDIDELMTRENLAEKVFNREFCVIDETISLLIEQHTTLNDIEKLCFLGKNILRTKKAMLNEYEILEKFEAEFETIEYLYNRYADIVSKVKGKKILPLGITSSSISNQLGYESDYGESYKPKFPIFKKVITSTKTNISSIFGTHKEANRGLAKDYIERLSNFEKALEVSDWGMACDGQMSLTSAIDFFPKETSFAILDATASLDYTLRKEVPTVQGKQETLIAVGLEDIRNYKNVTLHYTFTQTGKSSILDPKNKDKFGKFINAVEYVVGTNKDTLIVCHKDSLSRFESLELKDNYNLNNYGNITGKNEWKDCSVVALYGLFHKPEHTLINHFVVNSGLEFALSEDGLEAKLKYELEDLTRDIIQAVNRIRTRVVIDEEGNCGKSDVFVTLPKGKRGEYILNKIIKYMPGIKTQSFDFEIQDSREFTGANQKRLVATLSRLCSYDTPIAASTLKKEASIDKNQWKSLKSNKEFFKTLEDFYGFRYEQLSGNKARFIKVAESKEGTPDVSSFEEAE